MATEYNVRPATRSLVRVKVESRYEWLLQVLRSRHKRKERRTGAAAKTGGSTS